MHVRIFTDGGARGNPGPAGTGYVIREVRIPSGSPSREGGEKERMLAAVGEYIGETTNNQAEYRALIAALTHAKQLGATEVECRADSELLVKQLNRQYRVKNAGLAPLVVQIWALAKRFRRCTFAHVRRAQNSDADAMVNAAIDARARVER